MQTINFGFGCTALTFCFKFGHILGLFCTFFGPFGDIFWSFGAIFGVGIRFKNIFGTYLCSQSTLVLEVQPYLFAFTSAKFGAFFALFGPLGAIFGVEVKFKNIFGTYLHSKAYEIQTFLKYHSAPLKLLCSRSIQNTRKKRFSISTSFTVSEIDFYFTKKFAKNTKEILAFQFFGNFSIFCSCKLVLNHLDHFV